MRSPGRALRIDSETSSGTRPMPEVVMNIPSPLPRSTTLVSPVTRATPASAHAAAHRRHDAPQVGERQPFFEDERGREEQRPRAADGEIVHRAVHRQPADVAAGEEERPDDERIGREREPRSATDLAPSPDLPGRQHLVAERRQED